MQVLDGGRNWRKGSTSEMFFIEKGKNSDFKKQKGTEELGDVYDKLINKFIY